MVECDKTCQKFLYARYGSDRCLFPDALKLVSNAPSGPRGTWNPKRLNIAERSTCLTHDDGGGIGCKVTVKPDQSFGVLGAPCILFSRFWNTYVRTYVRMIAPRKEHTYVRISCYAWQCVWLIICRFGKREGFNNVVKSRCHSVGTAFMRQSAVNIHENVVGYDEACFAHV